MESSFAIANYFIQKSIDDCVPITPMKLLKLVYITHGWHLGLTGKPLISDSVQAWKYGPVVPAIYQYFRSYGDASITEKAHFQTSDGTYCEYSLKDSNLPSFLDRIWEVYRDFSGIQLSSLTHESNTPWDIIWNKFEGSTFEGAVIPNNIIEKHYKDLANANRGRLQKN